MSVLVGPDLCGGMGGRGCCCLGGSGWGGVWWLLPELLAGVPPPLLCVGTCGGGGRSSGVRLTSGVPCDPLWPPLLPRLPSAVTLSSSLSSESEILITISMLVQLSYGAHNRPSSISLPLAEWSAWWAAAWRKQVWIPLHYKLRYFSHCQEAYDNPNAVQKTTDQL